MPTQEEKKNQLEKAKAALSNLAELSVANDLIREKQLGEELNFKENESIFRKAISKVKEILNYDLESLEHNQISTLAGQAESLLNTFNEIKGFNPKTEPQKHQDLINRSRDTWNSFFSSIYTIYDHLKLQSFNTGAIQENIESDLKEIEKTKKDIQNTLKEVEDIKTSAKQAAGQTGVANYSQFFSDQAKEHKDNSRNWLIATVSMFIATVLAGVYFLTTIGDKEISVAHAIQESVAKIIVLSAFYYILVLTVKNYKAHRHNYVVNKHRMNSLNSFEAFVKSATDEQTKNAVLLQTTQSIFNLQASGYNDQDGDTEQPNKIIEILRDFGPKINK